MTHLLFHSNSRLRFTPLIPLNKALQIHNILHKTLIQYISKHQPHRHLLKYKLQPILQPQTNPVQNTQPTLNISTFHSNPSINYTTSRHLSRPPLQTILTNPLSYNLTSTNPSHTQQSQTNNNRPNSLNTFPPHV